MELSLFNASSSRLRYAATAIAYATLWYVAVLLAVFLFVPERLVTNDESITIIRALGHLGFGTLIVPLVENFLFISAIKFYSNSNPQLVAFVGAAIAAALHTLTRSFFAFGLFYIIAAIYLTYFKTNPRYAFFLGVSIHSICNFPASIIPLLYAYK